MKYSAKLSIHRSVPILFRFGKVEIDQREEGNVNSQRERQWVISRRHIFRYKNNAQRHWKDNELIFSLALRFSQDRHDALRF
jgi:hypothetical protein